MFRSFFWMVLLLVAVAVLFSLKTMFIVYLAGSVLSCLVTILLYKIYPDFYDAQYRHNQQIMRIIKNRREYGIR